MYVCVCRGGGGGGGCGLMSPERHGGERSLIKGQ